MSFFFEIINKNLQEFSIKHTKTCTILNPIINHKLLSFIGYMVFKGWPFNAMIKMLISSNYDKYHVMRKIISNWKIYMANDEVHLLYQCLIADISCSKKTRATCFLGFYFVSWLFLLNETHSPCLFSPCRWVVAIHKNRYLRLPVCHRWWFPARFGRS